MDVPEILHVHSSCDKSNTDESERNFAPPPKKNETTTTSNLSPTFLPWEPGHFVKNEPIRLKAPLSYHDFFTDIFLKNQLCVLGSECTDTWASRKLWVTDRGSPNFKFLRENFGHATAPITNCNATECDDEKKFGMTVSDFLQYWQGRRSEGHPSGGRSLYLKDWHFTRDFPSFCAYTPPSVLCSDWLNEFWDVRQDTTAEGTDDYRFVYMGPKNTWTPFHSDVLRSYSWSANICGRKKWIFFRPGEENKLRDKYGELVHDLRDPELEDCVKYPNAESVLSSKSIVVIQQPGEIVFVPSGWHHQVFNLEDTISINHNWVNGCSAHLTWAFLKAQTARVKKEIADCAGMDGFDMQCQKILKADSGMDYIEFYNFMVTIARHRVFALEVFSQHALDLIQQGPSNSTYSNDGTPTNGMKNIKDKLSNVHLCLWNAALNLPTNFCLDNHQFKTNTDCLKNDILVCSSEGLQSSSSKFMMTSHTPVEGGDIHENVPTSKCCNENEAVFQSRKDQDGNSKSAIYEHGGKREISNSKLESSEVSHLKSPCAEGEGFCSANSKMCIKTTRSVRFNTDETTELFSSESNTQLFDSDKVINETSDLFCCGKNLELLNLKHDRSRSLQNIRNDVKNSAKLSASVEVESTQHATCPHWAHCGCNLAVFDLSRILHILQDVTCQPEWGDIVVESRSQTDETAAEGGGFGRVDADKVGDDSYRGDDDADDNGGGGDRQNLLEDYHLLRGRIERCLERVEVYLS